MNEYRGVLHIIAMIFMTGTKYACNFDNKGDLIWMQYQFRRGLNMLAINEYLFSRNSSRNHSHVILGRFSTLLAYLVTIEKDASIYGSLRI